MGAANNVYLFVHVGRTEWNATQACEPPEQKNMLKTSLLANQLLYPQCNALTPIRDYENDYFHINDDKLPSRSNTFACRADIKRHGSKLGSVNGLRRMRNSSLPDILEKERDDTATTKPGDDAINRFITTLENLYESEEQYVRLMTLSNSVYRRGLTEDSSFRDNLIETGSNDELLLFGNIDTIVSISEIFLTSLRDAILQAVFPYKLESTTLKGILHDKEKRRILYSSLDLKEIALQHLSRVKLTYYNYAAAYNEQMRIFEKVRTKNHKLYLEWYEGCLKRAKGEELEYLVTQPTKRPRQWLQYFKSLHETRIDNGPKESNEGLKKVCDEYCAFCDMIECELKEYEVNEKYDFALTPTDIIQSYSLNYPYPESEPPDYTDTQGHVNEFSNPCSTYEKDVETQTDHMDNLPSSPIHSPTVPTEHSKSEEQPPAPQSLSLEIPQLTLPESILDFKRICKGLTKLRTMIHKLDFFILPNLNLRNVTTWRKMLELETELSKTIQFDSEREQLVISMAISYTEKIKAMKEQVTVLKLVDLELSVLYPITVILKNCDTIACKLNDLKTLRRDYLMYLKERKTNVCDVKRKLLGKHYETLQANLTQQLPRFNHLVMCALNVIVMNYNDVMIKYFKILSGGDNILKRDTEKVQADLGKYGQPHFDLFQSYSKSRHYMKKAVHKNWTFNGDPNASKVVRKLFEL